MDDSLNRLRKLIREAQSRHSLENFAKTSKLTADEKDLKDFWDLVATAYQEISNAVAAEGLKVEKLNRDFDPGFSIEDLPGLPNFTFWIQTIDRHPKAHARRGTLVVSTPELSSNKPVDISKVTQKDIKAAVTYAYEFSDV
jgi:hypothetical protein